MAIRKLTATSAFRLFPLFLSLVLIFGAVAAPIAMAQGNDQQIQADLLKKLDKKQFRSVTGAVVDGVVTLTGSVDLYEYKADADKQAHKVKHVTAVRNQIEVAGPTIADQDLENQLLEKLQYDRVGYYNVFDAISVKVQNGTVYLGGHARTYPSRDSAIALVSTFPGVKDLEEDIEVDPTSPMDDRIRLAVAHAIYGYPTLNRYALDPAKPIRISVQNGQVTLYGAVNTEMDKDVAGIQANQVSGVFKVTNQLYVLNPSQKKEKK